MNRNHWRFVALGVTLLSGLGAYTLQPDNLALFANPKLVAFVVGGVMVVLNLLNNWLPSVTGNTVGEKPPAT